MKIKLERTETGWQVYKDDEHVGKDLGIIVDPQHGICAFADPIQESYACDPFVEDGVEEVTDLWLRLAGVAMGAEGMAEIFDLESAVVTFEGELAEIEEEGPQIIQFPDQGIIVPE